MIYIYIYICTVNSILLPVAQNLSPPPDSCRRAILRSPVSFCVFVSTWGNPEVGDGDSFWGSQAHADAQAGHQPGHDGHRQRRAPRRALGRSPGIGTQRFIPTPDFGISPGGGKHRKTQEQQRAAWRQGSGGRDKFLAAGNSILLIVHMYQIVIVILIIVIVNYNSKLL